MITFKEHEPIIFHIKEDNKLIITELDKIYYLTILNLVNTLRTHYSAIIKSYKNRHLYNWLLSKTQKLVDTHTFTYSTSTRVYWLLDGIEDFPRCLHPQCTNIIGINTNITLRPIHNHVGYNLYCSSKCMNSSPIVKLHRRETTETKYGVENVFLNSEIKTKLKLTWLKTLGVDHPTKNTTIRARLRTTYMNKTPDEKQSIILKIKLTKFIKYNDANYNNIKKIQETNLKKRGVLWPSQDIEVLKKRRVRYIYNNILFDSSWELYVWIYFKDHNIDIIRSPKSFEYFVDGIKHYYIVDFKIDGKYVEIKGNQFFNKDGILYNPYFHSNFLSDKLSIAKYKCMIDNNIEIWRHDKIKPYIDYVIYKYGSKYIPSFRLHKSKL